MKHAKALRFSLFSAVVVVCAVVVVRVAGAAPWRLELQRFFTLDADGAVPADPFLANGVALGSALATYTAAGTGPTALNTLAPVDTPAQFIDYALLAQLYPDFAPSDADKALGLLPEGMTITEAQGLNCMARVQANLAAAGLSLSDITFMRIYLDNPADAARADYAGWNRAYRKYVANIDLQTGALIEAYAPVLFANATRPARSNIEVATLPVLGWLIEIEVVAAYPPS
jgi:enamine deaminase RidA (YjgF/YER057c/UK114 family)